MSKKTSVGIEYFLWSKGDNKSDKLIYYDKDGNCVEKEIPQGLLEEPLKFFDGKLKAVRRTSGGLSLAEPHQIIVYQQDEIRIRVRLKELGRNTEGFVISPKPVYQMKVVPLSHIEPGFTIHTEDAQTFVVDLGQGLVPIHLFHIETDLQGRRSAFFVLSAALQEVLKGNRKITLPIFSLPLEVIRAATAEEFAAAEKNVAGLIESKGLYLPDTLIATSPVQVPQGSSLEMVKHFLRISTRPEDRQYIEPLLIRVEKKDELLPFGLFETP